MDTRFIGIWRKRSDDACAAVYPATLDIRANGLYFGKPAEAGGFTLWDAGTFEVLDASRVRLAVANDALIVYNFRIDANGIEFRDRDGCTFRYAKG